MLVFGVMEQILDILVLISVHWLMGFMDQEAAALEVLQVVAAELDFA